MKKRVHYLCFYAAVDKRAQLAVFPSALPKIEYMINTLCEIGYNVRVVSACRVNAEVKKFKGTHEKKQETEYLYFSSKRSAVRIIDKFFVLVLMIKLLFYIMFCVKKEDALLVYHSMFYLPLIKAAAALKRINLILEVEEYYHCNIEKEAKEWKNKELDYFNKIKKFILINECMAQERKNAAYCISYGPYKLEKIPEERTTFEYSGKKEKTSIGIVYAGVVETNRSAAFIAVQMAEYLPDNYRICVLGFGEERDIFKLKEQISDINRKAGFEKVFYHEPMFGEEYHRYLMEYDIGVSCHHYEKRDEIAMRYTFPSKVLTYLNCGLRVVTPKLECMERSKLNKLFYYAASENAQDMAEAVMQIDIKGSYEVDKIMKQLHNNLKRDLKQLIEI